MEANPTQTTFRRALGEDKRKRVRTDQRGREILVRDYRYDFCEAHKRPDYWRKDCWWL